MIRAAWRRGPLRVQEVHFATKPDQLTAEADLLVVIQAGFRVKNASAFHTQWIDLTRPWDELQSDMSATTRNEVRRADRDHEAEVCIHAAAKDEIDTFASEYAAFSRRKHLQPARVARLHALAPALVIVRARAADQAVSSQAYLRDQTRLRLLLSMTHGEPGASTSRINRLAHVRAMQWGRNLGLTIFDLGGLALDDPAMAGVDAFKRAFGGVQRTEWNAVVPASAAGRLALHSAEVARWARRLARPAQR